VTVTAGIGLSTEHDPLRAGSDAAGAVARVLGSAQPDVAVVFTSGTHLAAPEALLEGLQTQLAPQALVGCGAGGVLADRRELESETAVAVWAADFGGTGHASVFHATLETDGDDALLNGLPDVEGTSAAIMLSDPYSFPADVALGELARRARAVPVLGGLASARTQQGTAALFCGERVCEQGAVGVVLHDVEVLPCVSQGAAPVGREMTVTAAEGNVIHELAGRPALESVERTIAELAPRDRALVATGLLIGIVIDTGKPEYEQGDFLVRGVLGADPQDGSLIVGASVHDGQIVRLHVRDANSAGADLRRALRRHSEAMDGCSPAGALVFACNGRGRAMFGIPDHDATLVSDELQGAPAAGFFAAGEIGPVGGRSFLHGFTATLAVFPR
jgi:small ligand-binding sensory domain FIST